MPARKSRACIVNAVYKFNIPFISLMVSEKNKCAGFWFVRKAHPPVHISGYVLVDATQQTGQRTSQMVYLFFAEALRPAGSLTGTIFASDKNFNLS